MGWIAYRLLEIDKKEASQRFLNLVKTEYEQYGRIFGMYNLETTKNVVDWDNLAAYAIIARIANDLGDRKFALRLLKEKVLSNLISDHTSALYGSFVRALKSSSISRLTTKILLDSDGIKV